MRVDLQFVGTCTATLNLDPEEYRGMRLDAVATDILEKLQANHPGVTFFLDDVVMEAQKLAEAG